MATQRQVAVLFLLWGCCSRASAADNSTATAITVPAVEESTRVSGTSAANTTTARGADLTSTSANLTSTSANPTSTSANLTSTSANLTSTAEGTTTHHPTTASRVSETSALAGSEGNTTQETNATSSSATSSSAASSSATSNATSTKAPSSSKPSRNESSTSLAPSSSIQTSIAPKPTVSWTTTNSSGTAQQQPLSQRNPGLIVVLCIFAAVLAIVLAVVIVKVCQRGGPRFKRLDELPMNSVNEEAPFARYPPK